VPGPNYWLYYDEGTELSRLGGLDNTDTILVWFKSPAACTLLEIHYDLYSAGDYDAFAADAPDTIDWVSDYEEYHGGFTPGPSPVGPFFWDSTGVPNPDSGWRVLDVASQPDVGTDCFVGGYVLRSAGHPQPIIDATVPEPPEGYHTLMSRLPSGGGGYGWYSSWHHAYIRALVSLYENAGPSILSFDKLPHTYSTGQRRLTAHIADVAVPPESAGVSVARVLYTINYGPEDTVPMILISGTIEDGIWEGFVPGASVSDTVTYRISAIDVQGLETLEHPEDYLIRAGQSTAGFLFVNDDYYAFNGYDPIYSILPENVYDYWFPSIWGLPDSSVIHFGYKAILWYTWDGTGEHSFAADTALIAEFLDNGGCLWISSQDLPGRGFYYGPDSFATQPGEFCHDYLHMMGGIDDFAAETVSVYQGMAGDPVSDYFASRPVVSFPYGWAGPDWNFAGCCEIDPTDPNVSAIFVDSANAISGYKYEMPGSFKIVYLYWPFNDLVNPDGSPDSVSQDTLVLSVLRWFGVTGVEENHEMRKLPEPLGLRLFQPAPNPALGRANVCFSISRSAHVELLVIDLSGRPVATLVNAAMPSGRHSAAWNGRTRTEALAPAGVYFCRFEVYPDKNQGAPTHSATQKIVLLR
jgi:hypothetical protein